MFIQGDIVELETKRYGKLPFRVEHLGVRLVRLRCTQLGYRYLTRSRTASDAHLMLTRARVLKSQVTLMRDDPLLTVWDFPGGHTVEREIFAGSIKWSLDGTYISVATLWEFLASYTVIRL